MAFIRSTMLFCRTSLTLLSPSSFGLGAGNLYLRVPWGTCIIVTPDLISEVLHVPRVAHLDYLDSDHLRIVSRDELLSHFCETPSSWGGKQKTPCSGFVKGSRFLNMVMACTLTQLSHYNSIRVPLARFLLSLLEDLSIDFPSHFITSILDVF